jgi:tetratricopeptide (TPR) repeat protein/predicted aspartyl protease
MGRRILVAVGLVLGLALSGAVPAAGSNCRISVAAELPVRMVDDRAIVSGSINGVTADFMIDSGAFFSMLSDESAVGFGLKPHALPAGSRIIGVGGDERITAATAREFTLAGMHGRPLTNIEFIVANNRVGHGTGGVIGQNILGIIDAEYDLANGLIRLVKADDCAGTNMAYWHGDRDVSIVEIEGGAPPVQHIRGYVQLNGVRIRAIFDTGATTTFVTRQAAQRVGIDFDDPAVVKLGNDEASIGRRAIDRWIAPFKSIDIGGEKISNVKLTVFDGDRRIDADILFGADFFMAHRIYVAYALRRMFLTYNGGRVFRLDLGPDPTKLAGLQAADLQNNAPKDADAYVRRGMAALDRSQLDQAVADFDRAVELEPRNADAIYRRGLARWHLGKPDAARQDFDAAIALKPGFVDALMTRGRLDLALGDDARAAADFAAAEQAIPDDAHQQLRVARAYADAGRTTAALALFDHFVDGHPRDARLAEALNERCWTRAAAGIELHLALRDCDEALRRGPKLAGVLESRGLVKLRMGDLDGAIADYRAALASAPNQAPSQYGLALALHRKGALADAEAARKRALELSPQVAAAFEKIGLPAP